MCFRKQFLGKAGTQKARAEYLVKKEPSARCQVFLRGSGILGLLKISVDKVQVNIVR